MTSDVPLTADDLLATLRGIHEAIRDDVLRACENASAEDLATVAGHEGGDTIYAIDRVSESTLLAHFERLAERAPLVLIAEGLGSDGRRVLPRGRRENDAVMRVIVDPIDGTRGIMYQKRPAWILTGVAPNRGPETSLADIEFAIQTEIPTVRQHLCDTLWAARGSGARGERFNRVTGERRPFTPRPSRATDILHGFGGLSRFFPGGRTELAAVDDAVVERLIGPPERGAALAFEDQYISTGGQLYELMMGHDRWTADLRPLVARARHASGDVPGLCCHPYDLGAELIAREAGVIVTNEEGRPLRAPLDVHHDVAWLGFANRAIADAVMPALCDVLHERGLL